MKKQIIVSVIGALLVSGAAFAKPGHDGPRHGQENPVRMVMKDLKRLELTDTQRTEVRAIMDNLRANNKAAREARKAQSSEAKPQFSSAEQASDAAVARFTDSQPQRLAIAHARHDIYQLLTDAQRQTLQKKQEKRAQRDEHPRDEKNKAHLPRAFKKLDLSEEQYTAMTDIMEKSKAQRDAIMAQSKTLRQQEQSLIQSDNFDEAAWLVLSEKMQSVIAQGAAARFETHQQVTAQLTSEQQAQLDELMQARMERKEKPRGHGHHGE
ncbi:Spy/CpxP family protein refolding chaperone [Salinimonas lutimaris]|uniref:Spy/CpxP family protein refolding chaperone n=1 Tax=Salinimonas lutimaris TaxID=914153 RepID=UPI0010C06A9A|nr:Spy/CpxP family protein refolding chaperone [Salinimonas lutimaris]